MRDISKLHPRLQDKIAQLITLCAMNGLNISIDEGFRTVAEQDALYNQGRFGNKGPIVANAPGSSYSSQHQWGIAVDFFQDEKGHEFSDIGFFNKVGTLAKSIGLGWGGDWTSLVDRPHLYLPDWGSTPSVLKKQYGTPEKFFATWGNTTNPSAPNDNYTLKDFITEVQADIGAKVDGVAGAETLSKTPAISMTENNRHPVVRAIQKRFNALGFDCGTIDGIAGTRLDTAMKAFQRANGCIVDGEATAGKQTWKKLLFM